MISEKPSQNTRTDTERIEFLEHLVRHANSVVAPVDVDVEGFLIMSSTLCSGKRFTTVREAIDDLIDSTED